MRSERLASRIIRSDREEYERAMEKLKLTGEPDIYTVEQHPGHSVMINIDTGERNEIPHKPKSLRNKPDYA